MPNEDELFHYGVKGMKWGRRGASAKRSSDSSNGPSRKQLREMDKVERAKDRDTRRKQLEERDATIKKARNDLPNAAKQYREAKKQYKTDRRQVGKVAAKRVLNESKSQYVKQFDTAMQQTRREQTDRLLVEIGSAMIRR